MADQNQAVAPEPAQPAAPAAVPGGAQDGGTDVSKLLAEFQSAAPQPEPTQTPAATPPAGESAPVTRAEFNDLQTQLVTRELEDAGGVLAEGTNLTAREAMGILNQMADSDPRLTTAWEARKRDPARWGKLLKAINGDLQSRFKSQADQAVTDDVEAVSAAVQGAQSRTPGDSVPASKLGHLSTEEFRKHVMTNFGVMPPL